MPLKILGTLWNEVFRKNLDDNFKYIEEKAEEQKARVDRLIIENPQPDEVVDARGTYPILGDRLNETDEHLSSVEMEVGNKASSQDIGDIKTLETIDKTNLVGATNEVKSDITNHKQNADVHLSVIQKDLISNSVQGSGERIESGTVSITFSNTSGAKLNITFSKPFTIIPNVVVSGASSDCFGYTSAVTETGFEYWLKHYEAVAFTGSRTGAWFAIGK
jgi:hypothetical protein